MLVQLLEVPALKLGFLKEGCLHCALPKQPPIQRLLSQCLHPEDIASCGTAQAPKLPAIRPLTVLSYAEPQHAILLLKHAVQIQHITQAHHISEPAPYAGTCNTVCKGI